MNGGKLVLDQAANPNAAVVNQGQITIKQAGLAALVAPQVANSGVITARLGTWCWPAADARRRSICTATACCRSTSPARWCTAPNGATALVTNTGLIVADGGTVQLTARAADGLVQTLVDAGGKIQANSVGGHAGTVTLNARRRLDHRRGPARCARAPRPAPRAATIAVNATGNVTVASTARINASGQAGGGVVAVGTTLKRAAGGPGVTATQTAANVTVQRARRSRRTPRPRAMAGG